MNIDSYTVSDFIENFASTEINTETYEDITSLVLEKSEKTQRQWSDERYQRNYGAWKSDQKSAFIESLVDGTAYNPIILAEIIGNAGPTDKPHVKYACLDGQHRSCVICDFVNDQFGFTGRINGNYYHNTLYKDLPARAKKLFLKSKLPILLVDPNKNLRNIFLKINSGTALVPQEMRNAIDCHMASWSRKQTEGDNQKIYKNLQKVGANIHRMADREFVSKVALFLCEYHNDNVISTTDTELDSFYEKNNPDPDILKYISNELLPAILSIAEHYQEKKKKIRMEYIWCYILLHYEIYFKNKQNMTEEFKATPISPVTTFNFCCKLINDLTNRSESQYAKEKERWMIETNSALRDVMEQKFNKKTWFHKDKGRIHMSQAMSMYIETILSEFGHSHNMLTSEMVKYYHQEYNVEKLSA